MYCISIHDLVLLLLFFVVIVCLQYISVVRSTRRVNISEEHHRRLGEHFEIKPFYYFRNLNAPFETHN